MYVFYTLLHVVGISVTFHSAILVQLLREQSFLHGKKSAFVPCPNRYTRPTSMVLYIIAVPNVSHGCGCGVSRTPAPNSAMLIEFIRRTCRCSRSGKFSY